MRQDKAVATVRLVGVPVMTDRRRRNIVNWLRKQANFLEKKHGQIASSFRARYMVNR